MRTRYTFPFVKFTCLLFICSICSINAQEDSNILKAYEDYTETPREVAYVHLNKSTYVKGEDIGFTAYILDKRNKKPSQLTTNLYITIEDDNKNILSQKLLKVENGIASNVIELDSNFTSGHYTFKAYTNWMRNFDEQNYFIETIRIIDPKNETFIETATINNSIDVQFLPESGHLLNNVINNVGVIIKDTKGYGVPNLSGSVYDKTETLITEFKVNHLGIGRFPLFAELGNNYTIKIDYLNKKFNYNLNEKIEPVGISLSLVNYKNLAIAVLNTNKESLKHLANKPYKLTIHNGDTIDDVEIVFNKNTSLVKAFNVKDIPTGLNILTLFNENNQPISERLFFNYNGIKTIKAQSIITKKENDSVNLQISYETLDPTQFNNISISVLPEETESYKRDHNILSYNLLQPFIKGTIEQAKYYFTDINNKTKFDLDNLLLTQGWSSYDWTRILGNSANLIFPFEQGINLKANINSEENTSSDTYVLHGTNNQEPQFIKLDNAQKAFLLKKLFVSEGDSIHISEVKRNNKLFPPKLYLQAFPNQIPYLKTTKNILKPKENYNSLAYLDVNVIKQNAAKNTQKLDEVVVIGQLEKRLIRSRELSKNRFGSVQVVSDEDRNAYFTLQLFLTRYGVYSSSNESSVPRFFTGRGQANGSNSFMSVFIDDVPLLRNGTELLREFPLSNVDYVEINRSGIGEGFRGGAGVLKIYTTTTITDNIVRKTGQKYAIPLTFSSKKKFYVAKYQYYNDDFYKGFGTIDWKPQLNVDANGSISMTIAQPEVPITLFIEGITNDGIFISEKRSISLN